MPLFRHFNFSQNDNTTHLGNYINLIRPRYNFYLRQIRVRLICLKLKCRSGALTSFLTQKLVIPQSGIEPQSLFL